jgi:hypothetical protein
MAVKNKRRSSAVKHPPRATPAGNTSKRRAVEYIFESEGLPGWLGWGTMGAESTYGATSEGHFFGLIMPSYSGVAPTGNWAQDAKISAHLYKQLVAQYGSVAAAVPHYSGNSYSVRRPEELGKPKSAGKAQGSEAVPVSWLGDALGQIFGSPSEFGGEHSYEPGGPGTGPLGHEVGEAAIGNPLAGFEQAAAAVVAFLSMLTDVNFWIRVGEAIGALILIYMGLHALTGAGPTPRDAVAVAAAAK